MSLRDWSRTPSGNANQTGIPMYEGMQPAQVNGAVRQLMADVAAGCIPATPQMYGAVGDGATNDGAAFVSALAIHGLVYVPRENGYVISQALTVGAFDSLHGAGAAVTTSKTGDAVTMGGSYSELKGMRFVGTAAGAGVAVSADATSVTIDDLELYTAGSSNTGNGLVISGDGQTDFIGRALRIAAKAYGILVNCTNAAADAVNRLIFTDFIIFAGTGDAIAINAPDKTAQNVILNGGCVSTTAGTGNGGLAISFANVDGFIASNIIVETSTFEGLHIEDGSTSGVVSNIVVKAGCSRYGVYYSLDGGNVANWLPTPQSNFFVKAAATKAAAGASTVGHYSTWSAGGFTDMTPISNFYIHGFNAGVWASGPGLFLYDQIMVRESVYVLKLGGNDRDVTVVPGRFYCEDADAFVRITGGAGYDLGEFHSAGYLPATFVSWAAGAQSPGAVMRGFSGRAPDKVLTVGSGDNTTSLGIQEPLRIKGDLTVFTDDKNGFGGVWCGHIHYDGTTFTITDTVKKGTANYEISLTPTFSIVGGELCVDIFNNGGPSDYTTEIRVHFKGFMLF